MDLKNPFIIFLIAVGVLLLLAIVIYFITRLVVRGRVLVSKIAAKGNPEADQYYYLPGYGLDLKLTGNVQVIKKLDGSISSQFLSLEVVPEVKLQADTSRLITLSYVSDPFSSDELKITTSPESLLQNVSSDAKDRIANIVNLFTEAPKELLDSMEEQAALTDQGNITLKFTEDFKLFPQDINEGEKRLTIKVESFGENVVLSLTLKLRGFERSNLTEYGGLFTRPMANQTWEILQTLPLKQVTKDRSSGESETKSKDHEEVKTKNVPIVSLLASFTCYAPDYSRVIRVPVRRAFFSRRQQLPGFFNGLLIENHITKDSEIEGFASIPLNILKSLFSIPAQLFQFRIIRNRIETEFEKSTLELLRAQQATREESTQQSAAMKEELMKLTEKVSVLNDSVAVQQDNSPALGKLPPSRQGPVKSLVDVMPEFTKKQIDRGAATGESSFTLPSQEKVFWNEGFGGSLNHYGNTIRGIQSCVPAAAAHMLTFWTANTRSKPTVLSTKEVLEAYTNQSGFDPVTHDNDTGCKVFNLLLSWKSTGIAGNKIRFFAPIATGKREDIKMGILMFGPCMIGLQLPGTARKQLETANKEIVQLTFIGGVGAEPGSWGPRGGGHAVAAIGYDETGLLVVSWGRLIKIDWKFYETYNDESYVALSDDWLITGNRSPEPSSTSVQVLEDIIHKLPKT